MQKPSMQQMPRRPARWAACLSASSRLSIGSKQRSLMACAQSGEEDSSSSSESSSGDSSSSGSEESSAPASPEQAAPEPAQPAANATLPKLAPRRTEPAEVAAPDQPSRAAESPVWRRTRAKRPLQDVSVEELEALLQSDSEDQPMEDAAYHQFLAVRPGARRHHSLRAPQMLCSRAQQLCRRASQSLRVREACCKLQAVRGDDLEPLPEDEGSDIDYVAAFDEAFGALSSVPEDEPALGKGFELPGSLHMTLRER